MATNDNGHTATEALNQVVLVKTGPELHEIGVPGFRGWYGFIQEEFIPALQGQAGRRALREMSMNCAIAASMLFVAEMILRASPPSIEENPSGHPDATTDAEFLRSVLFEDMESDFDAFISNWRSTLVFGWADFEMVLKRRIGPNETDPFRQSKFSDGLYGLRNLEIRAQETLYRWLFDEHKHVLGWIQQDQDTGQYYKLPADYLLHFQPFEDKGSPEGRSMLRPGWIHYVHLKNILPAEASGIDRELNGLPVIYAPIEKIANAEWKTATETQLQAIRANKQAGLLLPSDPWLDADGKPTSLPRYKAELMSASGSRAINTSEVVLRHEQAIARLMISEFLMLGSTASGSRALSTDKTDMYEFALNGFAKSIAAPFNRKLIPFFWRINGKPPESMPHMKPGKVDRVAAETVAKIFESLSRAGASTFPDDNLENWIRDQVGAPEKPVEAL